VDPGLADLDDVGLSSAVWNLFTVMCAPVPQCRSGELIFLVEVAAAPAGRRESATTRCAVPRAVSTPTALLGDGERVIDLRCRGI
jgi:hypothetical protein